ncbi:Rad52/Rad22 family DNA repair protein [Bacillus stercoris]|nr:Rad52/Rad22 family DNA repair protein [Bacillus stercoris]
MSKSLEVFSVHPEAIQYDIDKAKQVINDKLEKSWIKERTQGKTTLSYIGGHTVIRLLNKAFNHQWSFEIVKEEIVESLPKAVYDGWGKQRKPRLDKDGNQVYEPQPPVAKVLGRLTVPGLAIKEQYGSKVLVGGATEQESAFKSASTDALKKCASLLGIGLELYGEDEGMYDEEVQEEVSSPNPKQPVEKQVSSPEQTAPAQEKPEQQKATSQEPPASSQPKEAQTASNAPSGWKQEDINRLKELKAILGITENHQLDPYVREFFDNPNVTVANITPENIKAVNLFLAKKAEQM